MDIVNILLVVVFSINFVLATMVFINRKNSVGSVFFALAAYSTTVWVLSMFFFRKISDGQLLIIPTKLLYVAGILIASNFLRFSDSFLSVPTKKYRGLLSSVTLPTLLLILLIIFSDTIIRSVYFMDDQKIVSFGPVYYAYGLLMTFYFIWSYRNFLKRFFSSKISSDKQRILYTVIGTGISVIFGLTFDILEPLFGNFTYYWLGPVMTVVFVSLTTYAIFKHELFNVKIIAAELFTFSLWILISIRAFLSTTIEDQLINGALLIATVILGIFLIRGVIKEVETREKIQKLAEDLERANARLKELDQQKTEFLSFASHQLRSPLSAIQGYASMLLEGSFGKISDKVGESVHRILLSSQHLLNLIEDFLNITRIELGKMQYNFTAVDLGAMTEDIIGALLPNAQKKNLKLTFAADNHPPYKVLADYEKIRQVVLNLIDNAIKYTPKGFVKVKISKNDATHKILLSVADSGLGISPELKDRLFEKFSRGDSVQKLHVNGTGLGLYVAKEMLKAHGGDIWAESPGEGKGSTFFIEILAEEEAEHRAKVKELAQTL